MSLDPNWYAQDPSPVPASSPGLGDIASQIVAANLAAFQSGVAAVSGVFTGGQAAIRDTVTQTAGVVGGTVKGVVDDVADAANPLNLAGAGLGLGLGGVFGVIGAGLLGGILVDTFFLDGAGTRALLAKVQGGRKR